MNKCLLMIGVVFVLFGCKQDFPEPESVSAAHIQHTQQKKLQVRHIVQGNNVFVECVVQGVSFASEKGKKNGKIIVYLDGKRFGEYHTAAFVMKGVKKGVHLVKIDIVSPHNESYHLSRNFYVTIS
jgi:hypothetical protein